LGGVFGAGRLADLTLLFNFFFTEADLDGAVTAFGETVELLLVFFGSAEVGRFFFCRKV
jgi:hypothetical protein